MTRLKTVLMATAAIAAMAIGFATTAASEQKQVVAPGKIKTINATIACPVDAAVLQANVLDQTQLGQTFANIETIVTAKDPGTSERDMDGVVKPGATWAGIVPDAVGFYGMQPRAGKVVTLKAVACIDNAKHPKTIAFVPRKVRYS